MEKMASTSPCGWQASTRKDHHCKCARPVFTASPRKVKVRRDSSVAIGAQVRPSSSSTVLRDRDKLRFCSTLPHCGKEAIFSYPSISALSVERQHEPKSYGRNSANNWSTALFNLWCPSVPFFLSCFLLSFHSCRWTATRHLLLSGMRTGRRFQKYSQPVIPLLMLVLVGANHIAVASPLSGNPSRTPATVKQVSVGTIPVNYTGISEEHSDKSRLDDYSSKRGNNNENISTTLSSEHERLTGESEILASQNSSATLSGNDDLQTESKALLPVLKEQQTARGDNNKVEREASHLQREHHKAVMTMPLRKRRKSTHTTLPSELQHDHQLRAGTLAAGKVTNDVNSSRSNILSNHNDDDEKGLERSRSILRNINDRNTTRNGNSSKCWSDQTRSESETGPFAVPMYNATVFCTGIEDLAKSLGQIPEAFASHVITIDIKDSSINTLNLSSFHGFPRLFSLSVTHSNVTSVIGTCPETLKMLNISFNAVSKIGSSVFRGRDGNVYDDTDLADEQDDGSTQSSDESATNFHQNSSSSPETHNNSSAILSWAGDSRFSVRLHHSEKSTVIGSRTKRASHSSHKTLGGAPISKRKSVIPSAKPGESSVGRAEKIGTSGGLGAVFVEVGESSNESNSDDDDDDDDVDDDDGNVNGRNNSKHKKSEQTSSDATSSAADEASIACAANNCHSGSLRSAEETEGKYDQSEQTGRNRDTAEKTAIYSYEYEDGGGSESGDIYNQSSLSFNAFTIGGSGGISHKEGNGDQLGSLSKSSSSTTTAAASSGEKMSYGSLPFLEDIDLTHNKISEVPAALLRLKSLKSLRLSGNQLRCDFVWDKLAENPQILADGDDTICLSDGVFVFTVTGMILAKKDVLETCSRVDKNQCHECSLYALNKQPGHGYNLSHQSPHGDVAIALKLDCSFQNLTELPVIPPHTWQLNISGNFIKDLSSLKEPMYENLLTLDADSNEINNLDGLIGTSFLDRYNYLSLQNNRFTVIPSNFLSNIKSMRGQGVTLLGANFIDCDCDVVKDIKPLLLENSKKIKDLKEVFCKDMKAQAGDSFTAVKDLQYSDLCYFESEESNELYLFLIIFAEVFLIVVIVGKVWHDQRTFRRTGILPWCSAKMPRLPCDAMLESLKEPPHFNRSSSTNVRSFTGEPATKSISSHVQLRDVRSNSGQSEKSSQISQLSSFPCSSRTSSV